MVSSTFDLLECGTIIIQQSQMDNTAEDMLMSNEQNDNDDILMKDKKDNTAGKTFSKGRK